MCGIAGIISLRSRDIPEGELEKMSKALTHRGPDEEGYFKGTGVYMAFRGFGQGGRQPIFSEDKSIVMVFSGEIYNDKEWRDKLTKQGHHFALKENSEIIVHLYEQFGVELLKKIEGQFAFALFDRKRRLVILARDRVGICPMYYTKSQGRLYFASEIKAMVRLSHIRAVPDPVGLAQALKYGAVIEPCTIFQNIASTPSASYIVIHADTLETSTYQYHKLNDYCEEISFRSRQEIEEELKKQITAAVKKRMCGKLNKQMGFYISGGLDSAIIAHTAKKIGGKKLRTFSLTFEDEECDESEFQNECVKTLESEHLELRISKEDIVSAFEETIRYTEFPFFRTAPIPMFLLSKFAGQKGIKRILSGEGADEIFYGYDSFKDASVLSSWSHERDSQVWPELLREIHGVDDTNPFAYIALKNFYSQFLNEIDTPLGPGRIKWKNGENLFAFFSPAFQEKFKRQIPDCEQAYIKKMQLENDTVLKRCQKLEMDLLLKGYLLSSQGDRVLYSHSIEGRYPFLDENVIKFAYNIPDELKLNHLNEKYILREAYKNEIPEKIRNRKKFGYRASNAKIFFDFKERYPYIEELLSKSKIEKLGIFDFNKVEKLLHKYGNEENGYRQFISTRDDRMIMFLLGTQAVFSAAEKGFASII